MTSSLGFEFSLKKLKLLRRPDIQNAPKLKQGAQQAEDEWRLVLSFRTLKHGIIDLDSESDGHDPSLDAVPAILNQHGSIRH